MSRHRQDTGRARGNRLAGARSLYLRQHALDPVDWHPWGPEPLELARSANRPVLVSIGYSACHWCHVMGHEVFRDEAVAAFLNEHFVSIKVDREEHPEVDAACMEAVQAMTGGGGWPLNVFMTADAKPFFGGTYFPRDEFLSLLNRIAALWRSRREELSAHAARVEAALRPAPPLAGGDGRALLPSEDDLAAATVAIVDSCDPDFGGIRSRMKFPMVPLWDFVLHRYRATGDVALASALRRTLDAMTTGGIRDHLAGGFHRYTVDRAWTIPHFEKMLYDNALIARLLVEASAALREPAYAEVARETLDFIARDMAAPDGALFASIDADSEGPGGAPAEGAFYLWRHGEIAGIAGPDEGPALEWLLGVTPEGVVDGASVLTRRTPVAEVTARFGLSAERAGSLFDRWRPALLEARSRRSPPATDPKVVTSWAGLAIAAFAEAAFALSDGRYLDLAVQAAEYLWESNRHATPEGARPAGRLARVSHGGQPAGEAVLEDHAHLSFGLLWLHRAGGDPVWLARATEVTESVRTRFAGPSGTYYATPADVPSPAGRRADTPDTALPGAAAVFARVLAMCGVVAARHDWMAEARAAVAAAASAATRNPLQMACWLDAAMMLHPRVVKLQGDPEGLLSSVLRRLDLPLATVLPAPEHTAALRSTAVVCDESRCDAPVHDPEDLRSAVLRGWSV